MLDDAKYISQHDKHGALDVISGQAAQLRQQYDFAVPNITDPHNIVVAGMGGSALAAEFIKSWLVEELKIPIVISRDYTLPAFVDKHSLVIASSYSGNTEETLSALEDAKSKGAVICVMSAGGKLEQIARDENYPFIQIPAGMQPRLTVLYGAKALANLLEKMKLTNGLVSQLEAQADWLAEEVSYFAQNIPTGDNPAKQIAEKLVGHPAVMYGGPTLAMPAMKWKIDINENAKVVAFWNQLPEFNHNEFIGWSNSKEKMARVVQLHSSLDSDRIKKRFEVSNRLLSGMMPAPIVVEAQGETKLQQMLWTMLLGDFVSGYLAFLNGVDPIPVDLIEKLKKELG
jgi:glucose/mannose-6-phosphate isomerase